MKIDFFFLVERTRNFAHVKTLSWLKIPLDKELPVNCLIVPHSKLGELILVAMVSCRIFRMCAKLQNPHVAVLWNNV